MDVFTSKVLLPFVPAVLKLVAEFRLIVFRPFVGEVLTGRIMAATHTGIRISLEFFDDIFIPAHLIFSIASLYPPLEVTLLISVIIVHSPGNFRSLQRSLIILKKMILFDSKSRKNLSRRLPLLPLKFKGVEKWNIVRNTKIQFTR